jgi:hypothetical protein
MTTYISAKTGQKLTRMVFICFGVMILLWAYVLWQSYEGRVDLVSNSRTACERNKLDRKANASGWRIAEGARRADGQIRVANEYAKIATGLEERSRINCQEAFPKASLIP